ncbi:MAG: hypothetical protein AB1457_16440 [Chloroflexota bacterium]|nr:MAG: hypothetical protein KatS3mg045_1396 [Bellilinea sp.]
MFSDNAQPQELAAPVEYALVGAVKSEINFAQPPEPKIVKPPLPSIPVLTWEEWLAKKNAHSSGEQSPQAKICPCTSQPLLEKKPAQSECAGFFN